MLDEDRESANLDDIDQDEARQMLQEFCDRGFEGLHDMAALALGRDEENLDAMLDGTEDIDEDLIMKMRGIANERNIEIGSDD